MKLRAWQIALVLQALAFAPALAFQINLTVEDFEKLDGKLRLADLPVGDMTFVSAFDICREEDRLVIFGNALINSQADSSFSILVHHEADRKLRVILRQWDNDLKESFVTSVMRSPRCSLLEQTEGRKHVHFEIRTIDGMETMTDLIGHLGLFTQQ